MMKRIVLAKFVLPLLIMGCRNSQNLTTERQEEISASVKITLNEYYSAIEKGGLLEEFKYLDSSESFFWVPPGFSSALSYDSVAAILRQNAPRIKSIRSSFDTLFVKVLSENHAVYSAKLRSLSTDSGGVTHEVVLLETGLMTKRNGKWKLLNGHTSVADK